MDGLRGQTPAAAYIASQLRQEKFVLIDVGCSGGLDGAWRAFGDRLQAFGFDPSQNEVDRLNAAESNPLVKYVAGFVGVPGGHPQRAQSNAKAFWSRNCWANLSVCKTQEFRRASKNTLAFAKPEWVATTAVQVDDDCIADSEQPIFLPNFLIEQGLDSVDFIKIDVDGADFVILQSLTHALDPLKLLGLGIEVNYFGSHRPQDNSFHNTDRLMREHNFALFGLSARTYSGAALPWPYVYDYPFAAETVRGRPYQGDALYLRDLSSDETRISFDGLSTEKLAKIAAIFAIANLPDQAAEVVLAFKSQLASLLHVDHLLDLLALQIQEGRDQQLSYTDYMSAFEKDDLAFYRGGTQQIDPDRRPVIESDQKLAEIQASLRQTKSDLKARQDQLDAILGSRSWRWLTVARRLAGR